MFECVFLEHRNLCLATRGRNICSQSQIRNSGMHHRGKLWDVKTKGNTVKSECIPQGCDINWWSTSVRGWPLSTCLRNRLITYRMNAHYDSNDMSWEHQCWQSSVWVEITLGCQVTTKTKSNRIIIIWWWWWRYRHILRNHATLISNALVKSFH